jgi:hypothetical protein
MLAYALLLIYQSSKPSHFARVNTILKVLILTGVASIALI